MEQEVEDNNMSNIQGQNNSEEDYFNIQLCANCCSPFHSPKIKTKTEVGPAFQLCESNTNFNNTNNDTTRSATNENDSEKRYQNDNEIMEDENQSSVNFMLSKIYNLNLFPVLLEKRRNSSSSSASATNQDDQIDVNLNFNLCFSCSQILQKLYSLFDQFTTLRKFESHLNKQLDSLNKLITQSPEDDASRELALSLRQDIFKSSSKSNSNNNNNNASQQSYSSTDGPWIKIPRLEDVRVEDLGYAPPSLRHLYPQVTSKRRPRRSRKKKTPCVDLLSDTLSDSENVGGDDYFDDDNDADFEPSQEMYGHDDIPDIKLFGSPAVNDSGNFGGDYGLKTKKQTKRGGRGKRASKKAVQNRKLLSMKMESNFDDDDYDQSQEEEEEEVPVKRGRGRPRKNDRASTSSSIKSSSRTKSKTKASNNMNQDQTTSNNPNYNLNSSGDPDFDAFFAENFPLPRIPGEPIVMTYEQVLAKKRAQKEADEALLLGHKQSRRARKKNFQSLYSKRQQKCPCPCLYCLEDFQTAEERATHTREKHCKGVRKYLCLTCGATFKDAGHFKSHELAAKCTETRSGIQIGRKKRQTKKNETTESTSEDPTTSTTTNISTDNPNPTTVDDDLTAAVEMTENTSLDESNADATTSATTKEAKTVEERNFPCTYLNSSGDLCKYRGKTAMALKKHYESRHIERDDSAKVQCSECKKILKNEALFKSHYERIHTEKGRQIYEKYSQKAREKKKAKLQETNAKGFVCPHCNVDMITKPRYTTHLMKVHDDYGSRYATVVCEQCGKKFAGSYRLRKHVSVAHSDIRPYTCEFCGKSYKSMDIVKEHIKRSHDEEGKRRYNEYSREKNRQKKLIDQQMARKAAMSSAVMGLDGREGEAVNVAEGNYHASANAAGGQWTGQVLELTLEYL